jgi:hypothetical protein
LSEEDQQAEPHGGQQLAMNRRREGTETTILAVIMGVGMAGAVKVVEVAGLVLSVLIQDQNSI